MRSFHSNKRPSSQHGKKSNMSTKAMIGWIISILQLALSVLLFVVVLRMNVLPLKFTAIIGVLLLALVVICRLLMGKAKKNLRYFVGMVVAIALSILLLVGDICIIQVNHTLKNITEVEHEITSMNVYVLKSDLAQSMADAADYTFGILDVQARKDTNNAIVQINRELEREIHVEAFGDSLLLADGLRDNQCQAILLSDSFVEMICENGGYESFADEIRMIGSYEWKTFIEKEVVEEVEPEEDHVFTMYISGIDTSGSVSRKSRSDVNILAVVNTQTHQVQLISTPRDYYVPLSISDGVKDKLTHAGMYGVDVSMDTLSMLYGIDIDYYFRINFSGFQKLIDALGGITVHSDYNFSAGGYHFNKGENTVNGEAALAFARERHSFASGDRQRGKNQMAVITAVIAKMQTPAILQNFNGFMEGIEGSFESNLPYSLLTDLVKDQLNGGGAWNVSSYSVDGSGKNASTYSLSTPNYVMVPDMSTVEHAKELIQAVEAGEMIP